MTGADVFVQLGLEPLHVGDGDVVEVAAGAGEDRDDLLLHRHRRVEVLLEQLGEAVAAVELGGDTLSSSEPNVANASSSRNCARSSFERADTDFMALIWAAPPTRDTEMPTSTAGRTPDLKRSSIRYTWPSVIEMTFVGM